MMGWDSYRAPSDDWNSPVATGGNELSEPIETLADEY